MAVRTKYPEYHCIINNAGLALKNTHYTDNGTLEMHFAVNHLGPFYLTRQLTENFQLVTPRIVIVSSLMHEKGRIDFNNLGLIRTGLERRNQFYNNSKLANFYFGRELHRRGFNVHVLCPGLCNTDFFRDYKPKWYHYVIFAPIVWLMLRSAKQVIIKLLF